MSFTQVAVHGTVDVEDAEAAFGASVSFTLNTPISDGSTLVIPQTLTARCDASGAFSITLDANDDLTTQPTGSYYQVAVMYGTQTLDKFNVVIPHADSPSVELFTLARLLNPSPAQPYVSQIIAGSGIVLSPPDGSGVVTVSVAGGAGVASFNTRSGAVTLTKADVTGTGLAAADVAADPAGAATSKRNQAIAVSMVLGA